jgi:hypothetical protein
VQGRGITGDIRAGFGTAVMSDAVGIMTATMAADIAADGATDERAMLAVTGIRAMLMKATTALTLEADITALPVSAAAKAIAAAEAATAAVAIKVEGAFTAEADSTVVDPMVADAANQFANAETAGRSSASRLILGRKFRGAGPQEAPAAWPFLRSFTAGKELGATSVCSGG